MDVLKPLERAGALLFVAAALGCAAESTARVAPTTLHGTDGRGHALPDPNAETRYTVVLFLARGCEYVDLHAERLRALTVRLRVRGVAFYGVDPEVGAELEVHRETSQRLGFPVLVDPGARLAKRLGARSSGYAVVLDPSGGVHYRGAIDSDRATLNDDAEPYLSNALDDLLAGRPVRRAETRALGCVLRTW